MDETDPSRKSEPPLERLSVDELEARIVDLQEEIEECRAQLRRKRALKSAADALFGNEG